MSGRMSLIVTTAYKSIGKYKLVFLSICVMDVAIAYMKVGDIKVHIINMCMLKKTNLLAVIQRSDPVLASTPHFFQI